MKNIKKMKNIKNKLTNCVVIMGMAFPSLVLSQTINKNKVINKKQRITQKLRSKKVKSKKVRNLASISVDQKKKFPIRNAYFKFSESKNNKNEIMCKEGVYGWYKLERGIDYPQNFVSMDAYHLRLPQSTITDLDNCKIDDEKVFPREPREVSDDYNKNCLIKDGVIRKVISLSMTTYGTLRRESISINTSRPEQLSFKVEQYNIQTNEFDMRSSCHFLAVQ